MAKKLIEAIIFDMDGVIFDSENLYIACDVEIADKLHMKGIVEACYRTIGVTRERTREIVWKKRIHNKRNSGWISSWKQEVKASFIGIGSP